MWTAYFCSQFPSGVLGDRFGERRVILVAVGGTAVASAFLAIAPLFPVFVVGTIALGAVAGLHYSVATSLLTRTYDEIGSRSASTTAAVPCGTRRAADRRLGRRPVRLAGRDRGRCGGRRPHLRSVRPLGPADHSPAARPADGRTVRTRAGRRTALPAEDRLHVRARDSGRLRLAGNVLVSADLPRRPPRPVRDDGESRLRGYFVVQGITQVGVGAVSDRYGRDMTTAACMVLSVAGFALFVAVPGPSPPLRPASCFSGSASAGVRRCCPASWTTSRRPNAARGSVSCGPSTASSARWARSSPEPWQICSVGVSFRIPRGVADHRLRRASRQLGLLAGLLTRTPRLG